MSELEEVISSWPSPGKRGPTLPIDAIGALSQWQREIACGVRTRLKFDPLFFAAVAEANARDALRFGSVEAAYGYRRDAAEIIVAAARDKGAA